MINHNPYYKPEPPYYYTAYGIAVKHGFQGTEAEWLESLKGGGGGGSLPSQSGNSGKYLKTDGSNAYWAEVPGGGGGLPSVSTADNGDVLTVVAGAWAKAAAPKGISSIVLTSGNHAPGTYDTYTITYTDGTTSTFQVYNGANGGGGGGSDLPVVTASDNGKFLRVVNGAWAAAEVPIYNGGTT